MKACGYCGRENDENVSNCSECGTSVIMEESSKSGGVIQSLRSPAGVLITGALGVLLIITALFFAIGRALVEVGILPGLPPKEYADVYSFFTSVRPAPFLALVAVVPIFRFCRARSRALRLGTVVGTFVASIAVILAVLPIFVPTLVSLWCIPAMLFGGAGSSVGYYAGAVLQLCLGASLIIWFRNRGTEIDQHAA